MNQKRVERFLKELSELSVKHGVKIEGPCPVPSSLERLETKDVPGKYKSFKSAKGLMFHWVSKFPA